MLIAEYWNVTEQVYGGVAFGVQVRGLADIDIVVGSGFGAVSVTSCGAPDAIVTVSTTGTVGPPKTTDMSGGVERVYANDGLFTVTLKLTLRVGEVPLIVTRFVPSVALAEADNVNVLEHLFGEGLQGLFE